MKEVREKKSAEYERQRQQNRGKQESAVEMRARQAEQQRKKTMNDLDSKAEEKRKNGKIGIREEGIKQRQANAEQEKQKKIQSLNEMGSYISKAYSAGSDIVSKHDKPGTTEETTSRTTKTETTPDGSAMTTTTTTSTQKSKDGGTTTTKQTKQVTKVGGLGGTQLNISKAGAEETAQNLAKIMSEAGPHGTSGYVHVKTESWTSKDGIEKRSEKTQSWGPAKSGPGSSPGAAGAGQRPSFLTAPGGGGAAAAGRGPGLQRSPSAIKQMLLEWCKQKTAGYPNVEVRNFSNSWNDGMAFCALIHHFCPNSFDFSKLDPKRRRANFTLAFGVAEKVADIAPLLDVDDMVRMKNPDWKCVFTYVQSFYRRFRDHDGNVVKSPGSPVTPTTPLTPLSPEPTCP